jgi:tartrate dehydratase beta subunit/fumarate hydratase class I family protein
MKTPVSGVTSTATNHEAVSATPTTANSEKQYSPALLAAKPTGTKPAIVTSVPVSIGKAAEV